MRPLAAAIVAGSALCALEPAAGQGMEGGLEEVLFDLACNDFNDFSTVVSPAINEACCGGGAECTMNIPSVCTTACAAVLMPVQTACAPFLKGAGAMFTPGMLTQGAQGGRPPAPLTSRLHRISTHPPLNLHGI